ncbi:hypothetical protein D3C80_2136650 [compost metagenome]
MTESSDIRRSARNCLEGKVLSVTDGAVKELGLVAGVGATSVINASHIILGVPA